jgi:hypothetical protein
VIVSIPGTAKQGRQIAEHTESTGQQAKIPQNQRDQQRRKKKVRSGKILINFLIHQVEITNKFSIFLTQKRWDLFEKLGFQT